MIMIEPGVVPDSNEQFRTAVLAGTASLFKTENITFDVETAGCEGYDTCVAALTVQNGKPDLKALKPPENMERVESGPGFDKYEFICANLDLYDVNSHIKLTGVKIGSDYYRDNCGRIFLLPKGINNESECSLEAIASVADIKVMITRQLETIAKKNGATLSDSRTEILPYKNNGVAITIEAEGRKFGMSASVVAEALVELDDKNRLTITSVALNGKGGLGNMLAGLFASEVNKWSGKQLDLTQFMYNDLKVKHASLSIGEYVVFKAEAGYSL